MATYLLTPRRIYAYAVDLNATCASRVDIRLADRSPPAAHLTRTRARRTAAAYAHNMPPTLPFCARRACCYTADTPTPGTGSLLGGLGWGGPA